MAASRFRDFTRINPPEFHSSNMDKDPQEFIEGNAKIIRIMGISPVEKADLAAYQLKRVAQVWYDQLRDERGRDDALKFDRDWVPNPKIQGGAQSGQAIPLCKKCERNHKGEFLARLDTCYRFGKLDHQVKGCRSGTRSPAKTLVIGHPDQCATTLGGSQCQNRFYAFQIRKELEDSPDVVAGFWDLQDELTGRIVDKMTGRKSHLFQNFKDSNFRPFLRPTGRVI
ncbi:uncharacterized protein LOC129883611 [Solanum dulcamara]|uniref:uncharacterized protein LOC129883611 n=1 Tax=Solanum dulcamara TaxID=45834 RepID=UPI0024853DD0|nr:uncharacterized protein LOC129883611 [Solanum dulcamara]